MDRVTFRVPSEVRTELEGRAGSQGVSEYLRGVLAREWGREDRNNALQFALDSLTIRLDRGTLGAMPEDSTNRNGALMEILLLLRAITGPERLRGAQAEVERIGLPVWGSSMFTKK